MIDYKTEKWERVFRNLLLDIEKEQCVLLLGPEIIQVHNQALTRYMCQEIAEYDEDNVAYYYAKDGFFLFKEGGKEEIQREVKLFYEKYTIQKGIDDTIFQKIVELPFHLVISLNPDAYLSDVSFKYGIKHRFAYFHAEGTAVSEVETPTANTPLFYNLCGYKEKDASLILDYDDLFNLIQAIFGTPGLPDKLQTTLKEAKTFICLGFDFEKWYSQVIVRLLSGKKGKNIKKYAINTEVGDQETNTFLINQFSIMFLGDELAFFYELHERAKQKGLLRQLGDAMSETGMALVRYITNNQLQAAFDLLLKENDLDEDEKKSVLLLSSRYHNIEESRKKGILDSRDYYTQFNQIIDAILSIIK